LFAVIYLYDLHIFYVLIHIDITINQSTKEASDMDILTVFGAGATIYTALNLIPARSNLKQDEVITETFKQLGIQNKDGLLPVQKKCY